LDGGANNDFLFTTVTGTAAASPSVPAVPPNAVALAQIYVPGGSASVTAGNIVDRRAPTVDLVKSPQGRLAYAQIIAGTTAVSVETAAGVSVSINVPANRYVRLESYCRAMNGAVNGSAFYRIKEGAAIVNELQLAINGAGAGAGSIMGRTITPSAGPHTYGLYYMGNGANAYITADPTYPCWLEAVDLGGF
jgi:hypothetical protein